MGYNAPIVHADEDDGLTLRLRLLHDSRTVVHGGGTEFEAASKDPDNDGEFGGSSCG
jgi:hypothetical protein